MEYHLSSQIVAIFFILRELFVAGNEDEDDDLMIKTRTLAKIGRGILCVPGGNSSPQTLT